jgi:hypothetical protein
MSSLSPTSTPTPLHPAQQPTHKMEPSSKLTMKFGFNNLFDPEIKRFQITVPRPREKKKLSVGKSWEKS